MKKIYGLLLCFSFFAFPLMVKASHGQATISDVDHQGMGTFSGNYTQSTTDHVWLVFNANAGDVITVNLNTGYSSYFWIYQSNNNCIQVGNSTSNGCLTLRQQNGTFPINTPSSYTFSVPTTGQYAIQADSFIGQSGSYSITLSGSTATTALCTPTAPSFTACPSNITANSTSGSIAVNYTATASFGNLTFSKTGATSGSGTGTGNGTSFNVGVTNVIVTATNTCGSTSTATCSFTVSVNPPTIPATALNFDGVNDFVSGNLNTNITGGLTFQAWFKTTVNSGQIAKLYGTSSDQGFDLFINGNGTIGLNAYLGGWINANSTGNINVIDGNWHQATVSISNTTATVYIDGVFQTSVNGSGVFSQPSAVLHLGRHAFVNNLFFTGSIDDVRLWDNGLCSGNIQNNYNCELTGTQPGLQAYYKLNQGFVNANNSTVTSAIDGSGFGRNLALNNFALVGTTSNWVAGTVTGTCAPFVQPTASITASGATTFCSGGSVTLTANAGNSYLWSTGATTQFINVTTAGNYSVTVTTNGCSATSAATSVTVNPLPQPTILASGSTQLCSGQSVTLTASGSTLGNALSLDGVNDFVNIVPTSIVNNLGVSGFTIESWIKPTDVSGARSIVRKTGDYNLYVLNGSLAAEVWPIGGINNTWKKLEGASSNISPNVWSHVAATWDGTTLKLYINGLPISGTLTNGSINDVNENLLIGRSQTYGNPFAGNIDELRIWNTPRSNSQINDNRFSFVNPATSGLVAYYKFDEGTGTSTADATGAGNAGTLTNGATWVTPSTVPISYANYLWSPGGQTSSSINVSSSGSYTVTATNFQGCSATSAATVINVNNPPVFTSCSSDISVNAAQDQCSQIVNYNAVASATPAATYSYTFTGATTQNGIGTGSGLAFNTGVTNVTVTATNSCGNVSCNFTVTVVDNQLPLISCPANISVIATSAAGAVVNYTAPVGTDNCYSTTARTAGFASGSTFPIGVTTVTHIVTDASNNTAE